MDVDVLAEVALFLRTKYNVPIECTLDEYFQKEFNCTVGRDVYGCTYTLTFNDEQEYLMFLLKCGK